LLIHRVGKSGEKTEKEQQKNKVGASKNLPPGENKTKEGKI